MKRGRKGAKRGGEKWCALHHPSLVAQFPSYVYETGMGCRPAPWQSVHTILDMHAYSIVRFVGIAIRGHHEQAARRAKRALSGSTFPRSSPPHHADEISVSLFRFGRPSHCYPSLCLYRSNEASKAARRVLHNPLGSTNHGHWTLSQPSTPPQLTPWPARRLPPSPSSAQPDLNPHEASPSPAPPRPPLGHPRLTSSAPPRSHHPCQRSTPNAWSYPMAQLLHHTPPRPRRPSSVSLGM